MEEQLEESGGDRSPAKAKANSQDAMMERDRLRAFGGHRENYCNSVMIPQFAIDQLRCVLRE